MKATQTSRIKLATVMAAALCMHTVGEAQVDSATCGSLQNAYGPLDYRTERGGSLKIVEDYHFTPAVEALVHGLSTSLGGDLDYTLRAYPNHHRALISMMKLGEKTKSAMAPGAQYPVECYFERAIRFRKDDTTARIIYAMFLYDKTRGPEAIRQLDVAADLAKDNPFTQYNIGLVYLDHGIYDRALIQAHRAIALGFTRTGLKDRLAAVGKWTDPVKSSQDAASAPETVSSAPD